MSFWKEKFPFIYAEGLLFVVLCGGVWYAPFWQLKLLVAAGLPLIGWFIYSIASDSE